jgi:putative membrane protein
MGMAYLLVALLGAALALFAVQNNSPVVVRFLLWQIEEPLSLVILLSVLAGIVLTALLGVVRQWKLRARIRQLEGKLAKAEAMSPPGDGPLSP